MLRRKALWQLGGTCSNYAWTCAQLHPDLLVRRLLARRLLARLFADHARQVPRALRRIPHIAVGV